MIERPGPLGQLDGYFAAARIAHEYVADLHRELVELNAAGGHTRELLHVIPAFRALRARQNQIAAELLDLVNQAR